MNSMRCLVFALALASVVLGCGDEKVRPAPGDPPAAEAEQGEELGVGVVEPTGVPACDRYLDKVQACLGSNIQDDARAALMGILHRQRQAWKKSAGTAAGDTLRERLTETCAAAEATSAGPMQQLGCDW